MSPERGGGLGKGAPTPPRAARWIVALCAVHEDRSFVLGDLEERFDSMVEAVGPGTARRWYWLQALRCILARLRPDFDHLATRSWAGTAGDVRQSLRTLARKPLYTIGVAGTLALGLASAAVVASIAWSVWLSPMPFPDPGRVVRLFELEPPPAAPPVADRDGAIQQDAPEADGGMTRSRRTKWRISPPLLEDMRATDWTTLRAVAGVSENVLDWAHGGTLTRIRTLVVSPVPFDILGVRPLYGRTLSEDADASEVVLTEAFWDRAFGRDPGVVGSEHMVLGADTMRIVGVARMPDGYPGTADVVTRMAFDADGLTPGMRGARYLDVIARVDPAHTVAEASAEVDRMVTGLGRDFAIHDGWGGEAVVLADELLRPYRSVLALLLATGVVFLLLATVNVTGLVSARTVERREERAVRLALGASESRLLRGSALESALLGAMAAVGALAAAYWLMEPIRALMPVEIPRATGIGLGINVISGVVVTALVAGACVGVLGYGLARGEVSGPHRTVRGSRRSVGRGALVVSQIALTTLLACGGAGVLSQMVQLQRVELGFDPSGVASTSITLTPERYPDDDVQLAFWRRFGDELDGRGLEYAIATNTPMSGSNMPWGYRSDPTAEQSFAQYHSVSPAYFAVMGIDLISGRAFSDDDRAGSPPVVIVNEALASAVFGSGDVVGREIRLLDRPMTIVGVVRSVRHAGPSGPAPEEIYAPFSQDVWPFAQVVVRGEPESVRAQVGAAVAAVDPLLGAPPVEPYARFVRAWYSALRLQLVIVGVLAAVGTLLAALGLYSLVAYQVNAGRREIGIRLALGASETRVFSDVVRRGGALAIIGLVAGFALWYAALPHVRELLGDIDASSPLVPLLVSALVVGVSLAASALPARRSTTVDPAVTLRAE